MKAWNTNVSMARRAFESGSVSGHTGQNNLIAQRILDGEHPLDVMRGDKTRAFTAAIATDGRSDIATIDRHAHDVAMGELFTDDTRLIGKVKYRAMSDAYRIAAARSRVSVAQMQAVTWVRWKAEKGHK
jgi:hypothetical protein